MHVNPKGIFDIVVYIEGKLFMIIEVLSSPMEKTSKQTILDGSQVLRYLKSLDLNHTKLAVFCIPSLRSSSGIVKIDLEWRNLHIHYGLTCFTDISEGLKNLESTTIAQSKQFPDLLNITDYKYFDRIILLSKEECLSICGYTGSECQQISCSQGLLEKCEKGYMYKYLYDTDYVLSVTDFYFSSQNKSIHHVVKPEMLESYLYRHKKIFYSPMDFDEAIQCWPYLAKGVMVALNELRDIGRAHLDIRLNKSISLINARAYIIYHILNKLRLMNCWILSNLVGC